MCGVGMRGHICVASPLKHRDRNKPHPICGHIMVDLTYVLLALWSSIVYISIFMPARAFWMPFEIDSFGMMLDRWWILISGKWDWVQSHKIFIHLTIGWMSPCVQINPMKYCLSEWPWGLMVIKVSLTGHYYIVGACVCVCVCCMRPLHKCWKYQ